MYPIASTNANYQISSDCFINRIRQQPKLGIDATDYQFKKKMNIFVLVEIL